MSNASAASSEVTVSSQRAGNFWPFLISIAIVAGFAELGYAIVGVSALPLYITNALKLPDYPGTALAAFYLAEAIFNSPMGTLADKIGRRRLMVFGATISIATSILMALLRAPHNTSELAKWPVVVAIIALRAFDGLGAAMFWPAIFASIADRISANRQSTAMSVLNITYMIGLAIGPKVGGYLNDSLGKSVPLHNPYHYYPSFTSAAICFTFAAAMAYLVAPRRSEQHSEPAEGGVANPHGGAFTLDAVLDALRRVPILMGVAFITFLGIGLIAPNVKLYAMYHFKITEDAFGTLLLYAALPIAALSVPLGHLADRWGKVRAIHLGMAICAISLWLIIRIQHEWAVVLVGAMLGIGFILAFPAYMALLADVSGPKERGGVIGAVRMAQGVGAMIGTLIGSPLYRRVSHETPFIVAASFLTLAFVLGLIFVHERSSAKSSDSSL
jgi:DHA1 family multidrug resistance protein-like MFS transporter